MTLPGDDNQKWLDWAHEMRAIAQSGLTYTKNEYELERFTQLNVLAHRVFSEYTAVSIERVRDFFAEEKGYCTPKVDVRSAVFFKDEILLVQEKVDGKWALPGGWADVNLSPSEAAVKEVREESGLEVEATRLIGIFDRRRHGHPPGPFYLYKIIFQCQVIGGMLKAGDETLDAQFFPLDQIPPLSEGRTTMAQIKKCYEYMRDIEKPAYFD